MPEAQRAPEGRTLGRYTLLGRLAQGGMGEILLARLDGAAGFEKYVVIKRLRSHLVDDRRSIQAFLDEARIVARITHPNVCQVYELGYENGRHYLAMEYLEGLSLSGMVKRASRDRSPLDLRAVCGLIEQACEGLHHVHTLRKVDGTPAGVVHRDISPQNLFVTVDGVVKVLDFGIAKTGDSSVRTPTGRVKGKSAYMSPEQIRGVTLDFRSDIYSLGVVLYEAVTGRPLFQRGDIHETFRAIREDTLPFLRDVPEELNQVIQKAVSRSRDERYDSARSLGRAVSNAMSARGGSMTAPAIAEWLMQRFEADLEERRGRVARAIASRTAEQAADSYESRLEPGTVIAPSGTLDLAPRSDEVFGEPLRPAPQVASAGAAVVPIVSVPPERDLSPMPPPRASQPPRRRRPRWMLPVAAGSSALMAAILVWWTLGPSSEARPNAADDAVLAETAPAPGLVLEAEVPVPPAAPETAPEAEEPELVLDPDPVAPPAESDPVMTFAPERAPRSGGAPARARPRGKGFFTIDSMPYATIYVDGAKKGVTPILRLQLPAGKHEVTAVTADGRRQKFQVVIEPGEEARRRKLTW
ncbi:MAG TPA: serine/threonine-protein kinase [Kofleriaceae bacterium]|nr:serine/threonine-protein kinase [Kofleriaceae bacterium]